MTAEAMGMKAGGSNRGRCPQETTHAPGFQPSRNDGQLERHAPSTRSKEREALTVIVIVI